jgi:hypothetical protein
VITHKAATAEPPIVVQAGRTTIQVAVQLIVTVQVHFASIVKLSSVHDETVLTANPHAAPAVLIFNQVTEVAVLASTTSQGVVAPNLQTARAEAHAEVIVVAQVTAVVSQLAFQSTVFQLQVKSVVTI